MFILLDAHARLVIQHAYAPQPKRRRSEIKIIYSLFMYINAGAIQKTRCCVYLYLDFSHVFSLLTRPTSQASKTT